MGVVTVTRYLQILAIIDSISETVQNRDDVTTGYRYTTYLMAMTLSVLEGCFPITSFFMRDFSYVARRVVPLRLLAFCCILC